jgi:molybdopterin-containing oxidoreductase family iron-sulfur binding subunit
MDRHNTKHLLLPFEDLSSSRRGFLQLVGFGIASAGLAGCSRGPTMTAIPSLEASPEFMPGRGYWIASTCGGCEAGCGVLAKCRDGRPIKLEGTPGHPVSTGGLCPAGQGSILSLYDSHRFQGAGRVADRATGGTVEPVEWSVADAELNETFDRLRRQGGRVRLLTGTINGPSTCATIERFLGGFSDARHVTYDGLSAAAILDAHAATHGERLLPRYRFERARTIVSFDADFLSTWISPVEFTAGYTAGRRLDAGTPRMSKHFQLEGRTSLTGCRADVRMRLAPRDTGAALSGLCDLLEQLAGVRPLLEGSLVSAPEAASIEQLAEALWSTRGESLVVAGTNDTAIQVLVNYANHLLDGYGTTLDVDHPSQQRLGDDRALAGLSKELSEGSVDALIVQGVNPVYDLGGMLPIEQAKLVVSCASSHDETASVASWVCPEPHALESFDDAEPHVGTYVLRQPTVPLLRDGRTLRESLAGWSGDTRSDSELLRDHWRSEIFPRQRTVSDFDVFFDQALHDGHALVSAPPKNVSFTADAVRAVARGIEPGEGELELVLYPKAGMLDGRHAHNPWLHELPDPVSKITWDNYACVSPEAAASRGLSEGDGVRVALAGGAQVELPVHVQRGQHDGVVAVALGYGRAGTDRFTNVGPEWIEGEVTVEAGGVVGVDAAGMMEWAGRERRSAGAVVSLERTGTTSSLASAQDYHSMTLPEHLAVDGHEVREVVFSGTFDEWKADPGGAVHRHALPEEDLWTEDHETETSWGMAIDLASCTGCSACVIGCQAENNVPVVGRDEVRLHREMSWLRIDRYYEGEDDDLRTLHQPMLCQHCDHAPCESVCPVLATVHSSEGVNQQVYNRCVGTRYCANTCPYKVRRFNWFNYPHDDKLQNHSLNPDVTVRSRGVMEKCSFCIQRIQEAKSEARREGRLVGDGEVATACQQSCPANAIVFGNLKDPESRVAKLAATPRAYSVLEELNVRPSVRYLAHVHNGESHTGHGAEDGHAH